MNQNSSRPRFLYRPQVFTASSIGEAMRIIVTPEDGTTTAERRAKETPFISEECGRWLDIGPDACVLDYGCGIGRVAKGLIERFGCRVVGVDFSPSMRLLAPDYVLSERFTAWSVATLDAMVGKGVRADAAVCIWVIQHALDANAVAHRIARALNPGGGLYALNSGRCVPTDRGWTDDGVNVPELLRTVFLEESWYRMPERVTTPQLAANSVIQVLRKPTDSKDAANASICREHGRR